MAEAGFKQGPPDFKTYTLSCKSLCLCRNCQAEMEAEAKLHSEEGLGIIFNERANDGLDRTHQISGCWPHN